MCLFSLSDIIYWHAIGKREKLSGICMCLCMCVCVSVSVYVCMYVWMYVCMHVCMYIHMYVWTVYVYMYVCMYVCMYELCMRVCVCMYVCTYVCMYVCMYVWTIYVYRVSQEECEILQEGVPYVKLYRYNPKYLYPKLNGYGDNGQRKVWTSCISAYCTSTADSPLTL